MTGIIGVDTSASLAGASLAEASAGSGTLVDWFVTGVFLVLAGAMILTTARLLWGPTLPDRVVALDLLAYFVAGAIAAYAIATGRPVLVDVAVVLALILFVGTAAFALYVARRGRP